MERQGHIQVLGGGPERIVVGVAIGLFIRWRGPDHRPPQALVGTPFEFGHTSVNIFERHQPDADQPVGIIAAILGHKVVIGPEAGTPQSGVVQAVQHHAERGVQHLGRHPVPVLFFEAFGRIPHTGRCGGKALFVMVGQLFGRNPGAERPGHGNRDVHLDSCKLITSTLRTSLTWWSAERWRSISSRVAASK